MKIGIFCPNWVGDLVMATPALRSLRNEYPQSEIVAILRPHLAAVLDGLTLVDRVIIDPHQGGKNLWAGLRFARSLRSERFDLILLLTNSFRTGLWAWLAGGRRRVGFEGNLRSLLLTERVPRRNRKEPHPVLPEYLRLAEAVGCRELTTETELVATENDERQLEEFWRSTRPEGRPKRVVCLNPGGAFGAAKHWPTEHFAELARRMVDELAVEVLVLCGPAERIVAQEIIRLANRPRVHSLAHVRPSIGLSKAAVKHCDLLVTTDSGPRHFAAPFNRPAITLFGPTHPAWSETNHPRAVGLQHPVDCGPCQQRSCPLGHHDCLKQLLPARVFAVARNLLLAEERTQAAVELSARAA